MKAIFIAAGEGSRLGNITKEIPKALVDVNGKSILERQISLLNKNNIYEIIVVTGHYKEKFTFKNITYVYNYYYKEQEQVGSLMAARTEIKGELIVIFGDILFDEKILRQILNSNGDIVIAVDSEWEKSYDIRTDNSKNEADKVITNDGVVVKIFKNYKTEYKRKEISEFLGLMKLSPIGSQILTDKYSELELSHSGRFHDAISLKKAKLVDIIEELIDSNVKIEAVKIHGKWCEIDTPQDLERARKMFT